MPPGRSHTPLFELISRDEPNPSLPEPGRPRPSHAPGRVTLSPAAIYGFVAASIALIVAAWSIGYRVGFNAGEQSWSEKAPPIALPDPGPLAHPSQIPTPEPDAQPTSPAGRPAESPPILSPQGPLETDPRSPGSNYLELATLTQEQAQDAIQFLSRRGVPAIAVPLVDSRARQANNPPRYRLISIKLAIPSEQYRESEAQRRAHENEIRRLGAEWQQNHGGASDFARPLWTKYP